MKDEKSLNFIVISKDINSRIIHAKFRRKIMNNKKVIAGSPILQVGDNQPCIGLCNMKILHDKF